MKGGSQKSLEIKLLGDGWKIKVGGGGGETVRYISLTLWRG